MMLKRIVLATACATSFAIAACSSGNSTSGTDGGSSTGTSSSGTGNPGSCPTYHACQFLTDDQVNTVIGSGGVDAGLETNATIASEESTSCLYLGSTGNLSIALTCGQQQSIDIIKSEQPADASITDVPNLGMQALAIGDNKIFVFATSTVSFQVTVTAHDGSVPANALDTAKTVASEVVAKL
jgi:hypothetical protein